MNKRQEKRGRKTARLSTHLTVTKTKHLWGWMELLRTIGTNPCRESQYDFQHSRQISRQLCAHSCRGRRVACNSTEMGREDFPFALSSPRAGQETFRLRKRRARRGPARSR